MRRKNRKRNRIILSMLLSAVLAIEPIGLSTIAYAEEGAQSREEQEQPADPDENMSDDAEGTEENADDGSEDGDGQKVDDSEGEEEHSGAEGDEIPSDDDSDIEDEVSDDSDMTEEEGEPETDSDTDNEDEVPNEEELPDEDELPGETEVSDEDADEEEESSEDTEKELFSGMPENYRLTSQQQAEKRLLAGMLGDVDEKYEGVQYVSRQIMTLVDSQREAEMIAEAYNADIESFENGLLVMTLAEGTTVHDALEAAASSGTTLPAVWPNYYRYIHEEELIEIEETEYDIDSEEYEEGDIPTQESYDAAVASYNDTYLNPANSSYQWQHVAVGSPYAWSEGYKGQGVKVAILDTGVLETHNDLKENIAGSYNASSTSDTATDKHGHGTHVAGIIGAQLNNGKGGAGIAPEAELYCIKVMGDNGSGTDEDIIQGLIQAIELDVDVVNMSIGGPGFNGAFQEVVDEAYEKGIAIFASAGNDGISVMNYPACYDHVICVAATDANNVRAAFSTYGSWVDISVPGLNILSTYKNSDSSYASMSGTSQACPVAVGEAAVILGAYDSLRGVDKDGKKVDALETLMKKNSVKVSGTGMGSGVPSLTKVFGLSTAATKPNAPTITSGILEVDGKPFVEVTITAQAGMKLCYTTNGKNPVLKNGETDDNTTLVADNTVKIYFDSTQTAKGTVKAFAINASGVISSVKSHSYNYPYVITIDVSGSQRVEQGKNVQLAATATPTSAKNKKVTWSLDSSADAAGVTINSSGKVTVAKDAKIGNYTVTVTAQDDGQKSVTYPIQVVAANSSIHSLAFDTMKSKDLKEIWIPQSQTVPLSFALIAKEKNEAGTLVEITDALGDRVKWTSSKPAVATVDDNGNVTAKTAGTTTITVKANDSGGKKATINITVKQAVTSIMITTSKGATDDKFFTVAAGKSLSLKASINPTKPANKKIKWSISPENENVSINASNGKITVKKGAQTAEYTVTATADDNKGAKAIQVVKVFSGAIGEIKWENTSYSKATLYTQHISDEKTNTKTISATIAGANGAADFDPNAYTVTSSNESIVRVSDTKGDNNKVTVVITATGDKYGKANVVIASTDGSNKKATCAVTVSGGITKAELFDKAENGKKINKLTLFRAGTTSSAPTTATLYAQITASEGANTKAYDVTSNNSNIVSVKTDKETGEITLTASGNATGKATITLKATDGSNKKATCTVTVVNPVSKIHIVSNTITRAYSESGLNGMRVVQGKSLQLKAVLESEYGKVSNTGVTWNIDAEADSGVKINSSGKVTTTKQTSTDKTYTVTATAKDGSNVSASYLVYVVAPATTISVDKLNSSSLAVNTIPQFPESKVQQFFQYRITDDVSGGYVTATSSDKKTLEVGVSNGYLLLSPRKAGTVAVTLKATDGSGVKVTYKIRVRDEIYGQ